jgi:hypothetical protein
VPVVPVVPELPAVLVVPVLSVVAAGVLVAGVVVLVAGVVVLVLVVPLVDMSLVVPVVVVSVSVLLRVSRPQPAKVSATAVNAASAASLVECVFIELFVSFCARPPRNGFPPRVRSVALWAQPNRRPPLTPKVQRGSRG